MLGELGQDTFVCECDLPFPWDHHHPPQGDWSGETLRDCR
jgi:hypothetical protein